MTSPFSFPTNLGIKIPFVFLPVSGSPSVNLPPSGEMEEKSMDSKKTNGNNFRRARNKIRLRLENKPFSAETVLSAGKHQAF